MINEFEIQT